MSFILTLVLTRDTFTSFTDMPAFLFQLVNVPISYHFPSVITI